MSYDTEPFPPRDGETCMKCGKEIKICFVIQLCDVCIEDDENVQEWKKSVE